METLTRSLALLCLASLGLSVLGCVGTSGSSYPAYHAPRGFYYSVKSGDNLYRIGIRFGVPVSVLVRTNTIDDVTELAIGQRIYIPARGTGAWAGSGSRRSASATVLALRTRAREEARRSAHLSFVWPLARANLTSHFGRRRGQAHEGIDLSSRRGTPIRAAESGKVIHAGRLGAYGKVVILKHTGNYRSVYAHANRLLVRKGQLVERAQTIAEVGMTGRTTGPHLHFEIRRKDVPKDPMLYLP